MLWCKYKCTDAVIIAITNLPLYNMTNDVRNFKTAKF